MQKKTKNKQPIDHDITNLFRHLQYFIGQLDVSQIMPKRV